MRFRIILAALALAVTSLVVTPTPAFAIATNACHIGMELTEPIPVKQGNTGAVGYLYYNECSRSKYGWDDAQQLYVPANRNVRSWVSYNGGPWHLRGTWTATGWHPTTTYCGTGCWLTITYD